MFNRRHWASLVLLSTIFAVSACGDTPTPTGVYGPNDEETVRSQTLQVLVDNRSRWDLSLYLEGEDGEVSLGIVGARSNVSFGLARDDLGGLGVLTRIRAHGPHGIVYSDYMPAFGRIGFIFGEDGQVLPEEDCHWVEGEVCRF